MPKENLPDLSAELKSLIGGLREAFSVLRSLVLAVIAFAITLSERLLAAFENWQKSSRQEAKQRIEEQRVEERERFVEELKAKEKARVSEEQRNIDREMRAEEIKEKDQKMNLIKVVYPFMAFAVISTLALVVGVVKLSPIAKWTRNQNECIEKISIDGSYEQPEIALKVKQCNGGHD